MRRNPLQYHRYLDGEALFKQYFEGMGNARSISKLREFCVTTGIRNPRTGKPPTRMGIWKAMWAWALEPENVKPSLEIFNRGMSLSGEHYTEEDWREFIMDKAQGGVELTKRKFIVLEASLNG